MTSLGAIHRFQVRSTYLFPTWFKQFVFPSWDELRQWFEQDREDK